MYWLIPVYNNLYKVQTFNCAIETGVSPFNEALVLPRGELMGERLTQKQP